MQDIRPSAGLPPERRTISPRIPQNREIVLRSDGSGDYTEQVLGVVESIPPGRVMTYGDVAWVFDRPGARAVGMVLARYGSDVPWWRVVRAGGHPPTGHAVRAREHYLNEHTPLVETDAPDGYRVDLRRAAWSPPWRESH